MELILQVAELNLDVTDSISQLADSMPQLVDFLDNWWYDTCGLPYKHDNLSYYTFNLIVVAIHYNMFSVTVFDTYKIY